MGIFDSKKKKKRRRGDSGIPGIEPIDYTRRIEQMRIRVPTKNGFDKTVEKLISNGHVITEDNGVARNAGRYLKPLRDKDKLAIGWDRRTSHTVIGLDGDFRVDEKKKGKKGHRLFVISER